MQAIMESYGDMLYRMCFVMLRNSYDAEDAVQETLMKYITKKPNFANEEHRKAWLLRVANNICKDLLRYISRHNHLDIDELQICETEQDKEILQQVMRLPPKYKAVIMLHYIEGYSVRETAEILKLNESAVKKQLQRGRELLKLELGGDLQCVKMN